MPAGIQNVEGQLPGPPAFRSAVMSSQIFLYSGVSGGWPASGIQLFGVPGPRIHCPLRFGYFPKSTWAAVGVANSATANAAAYIKPRFLSSCFFSFCFLMGILQIGRSAHERGAPSTLILLVVGGRIKNRPASCGALAPLLPRS